ncbi:MAG: type II secretion system protein GspM [Hyphomonadaceae bacterium]|nr:type II secretion system protein GspM [Hyphomonadaceae bacterium]
MMGALQSWWAARDARERLIVRGGVAIVLLLLVPFLIYQSVARYRESAAADLAAARAVMADVRAIAEAGPPPPTVGAGGVRDVLTANAASSGLTVLRVEPGAGDRIVIAFGPSDSLGVYRWIDGVGKAGVRIHRTAIVRAGENGVVTAEFEVGAGT